MLIVTSREDNLKLRLAMPDEDEKAYDIPYSRSHRNEGKKVGHARVNDVPSRFLNSC